MRYQEAYLAAREAHDRRVREGHKTPPWEALSDDIMQHLITLYMAFCVIVLFKIIDIDNKY